MSEEQDIDPFESLLKSRERILNRIHNIEEEKNVAPTKANEYQKADKGCSLSDFFTMVKKVVVRGLKKYNIRFIPDDGAYVLKSLSEKNNQPIIYYNLISRVPRETDRKPRFRQDIQDRDASGNVIRTGAINAQIFDCDVQFNIAAADYSTADKVMDAFEDAMLRYSGHFKRNGVSEMYFRKQYTDTNLNPYRQELSIRSLVYRITIERIRTTFDTTITEIDQL